MTDKNQQIIAASVCIYYYYFELSVRPSTLSQSCFVPTPTKTKKKKRKKREKKKMFPDWGETIRLRCSAAGQMEKGTGLQTLRPSLMFIVYIKRWTLHFAVVSHFSVGMRRMGWLGGCVRRNSHADSLLMTVVVIVTLHRRQEMKGPTVSAKWCAQCCSSCCRGGWIQNRKWIESGWIRSSFDLAYTHNTQPPLW